MFCEFCGKRIDPKKRACPYCGQQQTARSGGNGFWDILSPQPVMERTSGAEQQPPVVTRREPDREFQKNGRKKRSHLAYRLMSITMLMILLLSIAMNVSVFWELCNLKQRIDVLESDIETQKLKNTEPEPTWSDPPAVKDSQSHPELATDESEKMSMPETTEESQNPERDTQITEQVSQIITEQPKDIEWSGSPVEFSIKYVKTDPERVFWEYKDEQGKWRSVNMQQDLFRGQAYPEIATLHVKMEDERIFTEYRCVFENENGESMKSNTVRLRKQASENDIVSY